MPPETHRTDIYEKPGDEHLCGAQKSSNPSILFDFRTICLGLGAIMPISSWGASYGKVKKFIGVELEIM